LRRRQPFAILVTVSNQCRRHAAAVLAAALAACSDAAPAPVPPMLAQLQATGTPNVATPRPGLVTAGQPTPQQLEQLAQLGVKRVICLRPATEPGTGWEEQKCNALGLRFERLPIAGAGDLTRDNAQKLATAVAAGGDAVTMVCCARSNRVGALLALKAFHVDGKPADEALALGRAAGLAGLEPAVADKLQR
jgi:uncharacterized protein (TIGR01244 family)